MQTERCILKQNSLANRIVFLILSAIILVTALITLVGTTLMYDSTKNSIENEIVSAAHTLRNLFEKEHPGDLNSSAYYIYRFGEEVVVAEDFYEIVNYISCSEDIEFTVFYGDTRIFTTIVNPTGSSPVGTKAADYIIEDVLVGGKTAVYDNVDINGAVYVGCYIPIVSQDGSILGMYFAGKPIELAKQNAMTVILRFVLIAVITAAVSLVICIIFTEKMIIDLKDIKQYINKVANGDFSAQLSEKTLRRDDEIGDISHHAQILCSNLRDMVERDPLTMLLNRRSCRMKLEELIEKQIGYTAVMTDIDFFKSINDTYGHACGDYVLKEISSLLKKYVDKHDAFVARWGGEEFLMVFPQKNPDETYEIAKMILDDIRSQRYTFENHTINITMTFGIAHSEGDETADATVNRADARLYHGKESGRNMIVV